MTESIDMIADDPQAPSFGGGATRVLSEGELDGLIEATVDARDPRRAPKETKRIEALARIAPNEAGPADASDAKTAAVEAALLDAAVSGASLVVAVQATEDHVHPSAPRRRWSRTLWCVLILAAALGGAAAAHMFIS